LTIRGKGMNALVASAGRVTRARLVRLVAGCAAGLPGRVVLFPSDVAAHRGWFVEEDGEAARYAREAAALAARGAADVWVVPYGSLAGDALRGALAARGGAAPRFSSPFFEVVATAR